MKRKPLFITMIIGLAIIAVAVVLMFVKNETEKTEQEPEEEIEPAAPKTKRPYKFKAPVQDAEIVTDNEVKQPITD